MLLEIMNSSTKLENLKIKGQWSITIHKTSGWRIAFKFEHGEFYDVEIVDYHGD